MDITYLAGVLHLIHRSAMMEEKLRQLEILIEQDARERKDIKKELELLYSIRKEIKKATKYAIIKREFYNKKYKKK